MPNEQSGAQGANNPATGDATGAGQGNAGTQGATGAGAAGAALGCARFYPAGDIGLCWGWMVMPA
jgi:hypothetical protein